MKNGSDMMTALLFHYRYSRFIQIVTSASIPTKIFTSLHKHGRFFQKYIRTLIGLNYIENFNIMGRSLRTV